MSGSSAWPYKKLQSYLRTAYPGYLPCKKEPITEAERQAYTNIKFMVEPYRKVKATTGIFHRVDDVTEQDEVFEKLANLRADFPEAFDNYVVEHVTDEVIARWMAKKQRYLEEMAKALADQEAEDRLAARRASEAALVGASRETLELKEKNKTEEKYFSLEALVHCCYYCHHCCCCWAPAGSFKSCLVSLLAPEHSLESVSTSSVEATAAVRGQVASRALCTCF